MNERPPPRGTVLIVDDTPGNLALLSDALEEAGYRVLVATDGISALEQLRFVKPDVILLDAVMPEMDGFETCRHLKADPSVARIPVLFMTALGDLDDLLRGFSEGAVDYIVKPFRNDEVLARVGAHLGQARIAERAEQALAHSGLAALAIDSGARLTWCTPTASRWLADLTEPGGGGMARDALPEPLLSWVRQWIGASTPQPDRFSGVFAGKRFSARIAACHGEDEYLLLLHQRSGQWDLELVRENLGLTFREAEVLMWIARGKTNRDVGQILGSSPRTVNKHLEHIFQKLGVETRSAAVALAMERMRVNLESTE